MILSRRYWRTDPGTEDWYPLFPLVLTLFRFAERKRNLAVDSPLVSMSLGFWRHLTLLSGKWRVPTPPQKSEKIFVNQQIANSSELLCALTKPAPGKAENRRSRISSVSTGEKPASLTRAASS